MKMQKIIEVQLASLLCYFMLNTAVTAFVSAYGHTGVPGE